MRLKIVALLMLAAALSVASCAASGARNPACPVLESLGFPADVSVVEPDTDTETTVLATNEYGAAKCGWEGF